jgi:hypothetical protein
VAFFDCLSVRAGPLSRLGGRQQALALRLFAGRLPGAADRLALLPRSFFRRLFIRPSTLHLAKDALALKLSLQHLERLIDVVVADDYLHAKPFTGLGRYKRK